MSQASQTSRLIATVTIVKIVISVTECNNLAQPCVIVRGMSLVAAGVAAKQLGVSRATLARWWANGEVKPALITAGGHARWDVEDLKRQLIEWRKRQAEDD